MRNFIIVCLTATALFVFAGATCAAGEVNLALGQTCTFNVKPNYNMSQSKPADLTDGKVPTLRGNQSGWVQPGAVGWANFWRKAKTIQITVDLGKVQPVGGVSLTSARGGGVVAAPISILVQTSLDGKHFLTAGDLVRTDDNAPVGIYERGKSYHTFKTNVLQTKARYVRFVCAVPGKLFSVAEVQVYKGNPARLNKPMAGKKMTQAQAIAPLRLTQLGVRRRCLQDIMLVRQAIQASHVVSASPLMRTLTHLESQVNKQVYPTKLDGFKATWPVNKLDAKIMAVRGKLLAEKLGQRGLILWHSPPYKFLSLLAVPPATSGASNQWIALSMMQNEHRARMFNLTNASGKAITARFQVTGLPGGVNPEYVHVFEVQWMDTRQGRPRDLFLKPLQAKNSWYHTKVHAGLTREIWLSFFPKQIEAGDYQGRIKATGDTWQDGLDLNLTIAPIRFPDHPDFTLTMWDYIFDMRGGVTRQNRAALKKLFLSHYGNMPWLNWLRISDIARYDAKGNVTGVDWSRWDNYVAYWPKVQHYGVYLSTARTGFKAGSPQQQNLITQFATSWAKHNKALGLKPGQVVVSFGDEPRTPGARRSQVRKAKAFSAGTQDISIHSNSTAYKNMDTMPYACKLVQVADINMPTLHRLDVAGMKYKKLLTQSTRHGGQVWAYSCTGGKASTPAGYYRLQPWTLFAKFGLKGSGEGFWVLRGNINNNDWNPYSTIGRYDYSPIYSSPSRVATGKQMEAIREGVEDWQYLKMLSDAGRPRLAQQIARQLHQKLWDKYGSGYTWAHDHSTQITEQYRIKALQVLVQEK